MHKRQSIPRKRKPARLRLKGGCFVADVYKPDGRRTTISFGPAHGRTEGEIYAAFGTWLDLFSQHPHKVTSFKNPYEAISQLIHPTSIVTVGDLFDKYLESVKPDLPPLRDGQTNPEKCLLT